MTSLPALDPGGGAVEDQEQQDPERARQQAVNEVLALAAETGRRAGGWVRELVARQTDEWHRTVVERAADAIEQASGREIVPGGEGPLDEELHYGLTASVVTGSPFADGLPVLEAGERVTLAAVCAVAAAMPGTVLNDPVANCPRCAT
ncbi:hypothetical protein [Kitasatospora sp. NPDC056531]|uniref:hypothetical protein n=1 Tax=Kitasatospora sp. NPDC056531 TaxID=3345856 RepID=UPI00368A6EE3